MKRYAPAAERNRDAIADVLARWLPQRGLVLEMASGSGEHVVHFARRFAALDWQPSDPEPEARGSIAAWSEEAARINLSPPLDLNAASAEWPLDRAAAVVCINMVHISAWSATLGLFAGAARLLAPGAPLILYGPYRRRGVATAPSNEAFDVSLKERDSDWGLRRVEDLADLSPLFALAETATMPANNLMLLFRRKAEAGA